MSSVWNPVGGGAGTVTQYAISLVGQNAAIPLTNVFTAPSNAQGLYRITVEATTTQAGTGGAVTPTITWNNNYGQPSVNAPTLDLTGLGNEVSSIFNCYLFATDTVSYSTAVSGITGTPQYSLNIRIEYLG